MDAMVDAAQDVAFQAASIMFASPRDIISSHWLGQDRAAR